MSETGGVGDTRDGVLGQDTTRGSMRTVRTTQRQLPGIGRTLLTGALLLVAGCGDGSPRTVDNYNSKARQSVETVAAYHLEAIKRTGRHLSYEETMRIAATDGLEIVAGASRSPETVSAQLQHADPGVVPLAAPDGYDCVMVIIRYPAKGNDYERVSSTWILIEDYPRNAEKLPSAVCAGEAYSSLNWQEMPETPSSRQPILLTN